MAILPLDRSKCTYAALAMAVANLIYWTLFQVNIYNTYRLTSETSNAAYAMYYYINYPNLVHGFQFIVFQNQMAIDQWLILPIFYFFQSALTLLILKEVIISLTGLLVFFIAKDLTKNQLLSLALSFAYFINLGIVNIQFFDYHVADLILPFYLLTFYYYMKLNKKGFYLSLLLLLFTMESIAQIAAALGLGLILYEYMFNKDAELRKERLKLAITIVVSSFLALLMYNAIYYSVQSDYATASPAVPLGLALQSFPLVPLNSSLSAWSTGVVYTGLFLSFVIFSLAVVFVSFGIASLRFPLIMLVFALPWLAGVFILQNTVFFYSWRFNFVLGGVIAGAILGCCSTQELQAWVSSLLKRLSAQVSEKQFPLLLVAGIVVPAAISSVYYISGFIYYSTLLNPTQQVFLFGTNQTAGASYSILNSAISLIPRNASLMTQFNLYSHLFSRRYIEIFSNDSYYFQPDYILWDGSLSFGLFVNETSNYVYSYITTHNYSIIYHQGNTFLLRRGS